MARDPICGMQVDENKGIRLTLQGQEYFFCSTLCRDAFLKNPPVIQGANCHVRVKTPLMRNRLFLIVLVIVALFILSFFLMPLRPFQEVFGQYMKSIWWAVLLGLALGGMIDYYIPSEYVSKMLARRNVLSILKAVCLGFLMSACSHGILALSIQLHKKGASNSAVVSFLLASPWANVAVTLMLLSLFGLKGLVILVVALIVAINTGLIFTILEKKGIIETNKNSVAVQDTFSITQDIRRRIQAYRLTPAGLLADLRGIIRGAVALADMVLWWILLGVLIASLAGAYIPVHFFHRFMGPDILGLLVTLLIATVIEVCSEGSSPLAFEIYRQTRALGNSFAFLMAGVATDYTEIGLLWANVGKRTAIWLPLVTVPQILFFGYIANLIFR